MGGLLMILLLYYAWSMFKKAGKSDKKKKIAEHALEMEVRNQEEGMGGDLTDQINPLAIKQLAAANGRHGVDEERVTLALAEDHFMEQPAGGNDFQPVRNEFGQ